MRFLSIIIISLFSFVACDKIPKLGPATENELASAAEDACGYIQNSYGQRVSWKSSLPISMSIDSSYPANHEQALLNAAKLWEDAAGMTLFKFSRSPTGKSNGVHWLTDWDSSQKSMQAITSLRWYKNSLVDAQLKIDARYYNFYTSSPSSNLDIHLQSLLVHELGHVLGMKHRSTSPTVMWATLHGATVREVLSQADIQSLKCEY